MKQILCCIQKYSRQIIANLCCYIAVWFVPCNKATHLTYVSNKTIIILCRNPTILPIVYLLCFFMNITTHGKCIWLCIWWIFCTVPYYYNLPTYLLYVCVCVIVKWIHNLIRFACSVHKRETHDSPSVLFSNAMGKELNKYCCVEKHKKCWIKRDWFGNN